MRRTKRDIIKYSFIGGFVNSLRLGMLKLKWILNNRHNETIPVNRFDPDIVKVGRGSYGELRVVSFGDHTRLKIGNYVSISENVTFLLDVEHYLTNITTYPFRVKMLHECKYEAFSKGDIVVDDDVWIGYGATVMSGVHIGKGAVVAAGAVVTKDVEPYSIVGGVPAAVIKMRFSRDAINVIEQLDFDKLSKEKVARYVNLLYEPVNEENADRIVSSLNM